MKFRVAREVLADAVAWTARSLPRRPSVPVLAGILLEVDGNQLSVSGFDYEVSARAEVDVHATEGGRALVPGRLLAEITRALPPHPVEITAEGPRLSITCSNARFSLPTLPVEDYPSLPPMPSSAGIVDSDVFAEPVGLFTDAAKRVALVAERGTPLRCEFTPGQVTLRAGGTDDEGQAEERCDVEFDGDPLTIGFNPTFLLDGLAAVHSPRARMDFTTALKPAVLSGVVEASAEDGD